MAQEIACIALTLLVGTAFGLLAWRMSITAGAMIGAMVGVAALQLIFGIALVPDWMRRLMQWVSGAMIGSRILRKDVLAMKKLVIPLCVLVPGLLLINAALGVIMHKVSGISLATALFGSAPGGVSDMGLIAADMGADIAPVSILQLVRLFGVLLIFPPLFRAIPAKGEAAAAPREEGEIASPPPDMTVPLPPKPLAIRRAAITLAIAGIGAVLFHSLGVSAGAMIGAMVLVAVYNVWTGSARFPNRLRMPVQILAGCYIGSMITRDQVAQMPALLLPLLMLVAGLFVCTFGLGFLMHKLSGLDLRTCLLASTPGGLQEMSLLAEDLGCDSMKVTVLQTARLFSVILLFPIALELVHGLFG